MKETQPDILVVPRESIPPIHSVEQDGATHALGELRDFRWHEQLKELMPPDSELSISWVALKDKEQLDPHVHPIQSMMIFYRGSGQLLGQREQPINEGDIVVVPPGCQHGFIGGPDGLYALSVQFGKGLYTHPETPRVVFSSEGFSLDDLLAHNQRRLRQFIEKPIFSLLAEGTLEDANKRQRFLDALQIWVDGNQTLLFARQASCRDPSFQKTFLEHLQDETGHDEMHADRQDPTPAPSAPVRDSVLEAITSWFPYQMMVLDNIEKAAIIHLVIENASAAYHRMAKPHLAKYVNTEYFDVHIEADGGHAELGEKMLVNQLPKTYLRLRDIIDEAWDMIGAMTDRVTQLTREA
ncbi:MAG TPA: AraC family ligand binding domain-containing protein [Kofleriaceae bacterium]|nr:AraC family ligand binding domain-containing protein [Kofleriaceae bacterium]